MSLLAGLDLATGEVVGLVRDRHRSHEFVEFLQTLDAKYPENVRIQGIRTSSSPTSRTAGGRRRGYWHEQAPRALLGEVYDGATRRALGLATGEESLSE